MVSSCFDLVKIFKIGNIDSSIDTSTHETFIITKSHSCDSLWMFFQKVLFNTQNQINNNDSSVDKANSKVLEIIFEAIESSRRNMVRHEEFPSWLTIFIKLSSNSLFHFLLPLFKELCLFLN